jgi:hypothetical protein
MRTQNPPPLKACRFDSDLGHHVKIRSGQGQATAATESNSIQSDLISGRIPPLSHPQLSACRCQDGLLVHARGRLYPPQWSRRRGLLVRNELILEAEAATHPLHIVPPPMTRAGTLLQVASDAYFFLRGRLPADR